MEHGNIQLKTEKNLCSQRVQSSDTAGIYGTTSLINTLGSLLKASSILKGCSRNSFPAVARTFPIPT